MIIEQIKNSIRNAIYKADKNINFHLEEVNKTDYPFAIFTVENFLIEPSNEFDRRKNYFDLKLVCMKSEDNTNLELMEFENLLSNALLPVIDILGRKVTLDNVKFHVQDKKLVMEFELSFYTFEQDNADTMENIDITIKGE